MSRIVVQLSLLFAVLLAMAGCGHSWFAQPSGFGPNVVATVANPLLVPITDSEFLWIEIVDTIDDYFRIEHEERVRVVGNVWTAGRIDTYPVVGASLLEPWRGDSTHGFERLHSTLQSVRRRAVVHVVPVGHGFNVEVVVLKELEDVSHPEHAAAVGAARHPGGTVRQIETERDTDSPRLGWISMGRDISLEQKLLSELSERVADFRPL